MYKYVTIRGVMKVVCSSIEELKADDEIVIKNIGTPIKAVVTVFESCAEEIPAYWEAVAKIDLDKMTINVINNETKRSRIIITLNKDFEPFKKGQFLSVEVDDENYLFTTYDKSEIIIPKNIADEV